MKKWPIPITVLAIVSMMASACTSEAPTPTVTVAPTATKAPTATPTPEPGIDTLTEEIFRALLSVGDVKGGLSADVPLSTEFIDYREMAASVDPAQVVNMDSWYGVSFQTEDGTKGMTFSIVDFDSASSAQDHYEVVKIGTPGIVSMVSPIGDASAEVEVNAQGIGSVLVFIKQLS